MPVLQANGKKRFLTSKVILTKNRKLVSAKHTQNRQSQNLTSAKISFPTCILKM